MSESTPAALPAPEPSAPPPTPLPRPRGLTGPQKAMLFLVSLDEPSATRLIAHLTENELTTLRRATESLREIAPSALVGVHREFLDRVRAGLPASLDGSSAYLRRLAGNALGEGRAQQIWSEKQALPPGAEISPLAQLEASMLASLLDAEHEQIAAIVLTQLDALRAAQVLSDISSDRRADILARVAELESVPESVLEQIEREFAQHLAKLGGERKRKIDGGEAAVAILKRLSAETSTALLEDLSASDPQRAETLRGKLFTFADLVRIDARGMQQLLKEVPTDQLVLALKTASDELKEKVFGNLSARAADMLREDLSLMGPVKVADVEAAQKTIVETALALEAEGRIQIAREGGGDYV